MSKKNNPWWRPSKMPSFIKAFEEVIKRDEFDVVILTDEELLIECNDLLEEDKKVAERTFQSWKAGEVQSDEYKEFLRLYKKALSRQKRELFKKLKDDPQQWQRYAWIIERKFEVWNLKKIIDSKVEVKDYSFTSNLESGDEDYDFTLNKEDEEWWENEAI